MFGLNETFLIAKSEAEASMMWGDVIPHEMNEFTKNASSTPMKKQNKKKTCSCIIELIKQIIQRLKASFLITGS